MSNLLRHISNVCTLGHKQKPTKKIDTKPLIVSNISKYVETCIDAKHCSEESTMLYLCVLDKKTKENHALPFRFALYNVKYNKYKALEWPSTAGVIPEDLEAITHIPGRKNEYIAMESFGKAYHIKFSLQSNTIKVLRTFQLPSIYQFSGVMGGLESLSLFTKKDDDDENLYIMYGTRGGGKVPSSSTTTTTPSTTTNEQPYKYLPWYCVRSIYIPPAVSTSSSEPITFGDDVQIHILNQASVSSAIREMSDACFISEKDHFYRTCVIDHEELSETVPIKDRINESWLFKQNIGEANPKQLLLYIKGIKLEAIYTNESSGFIDFATDNDVVNGINYFGRFCLQTKHLEMVELKKDFNVSGMAPISL